MGHKVVSVSAEMQQGYRVDGAVRGLKVVMDQPENAGGGNGGPTPPELLFLSLAGCICHIARIVARQRKIDLRGVAVSVEGDLDTERLMGGAAEKRSGFSEIRLKVKIDADLSEQEKRDFLHEVDLRCPVSDNLKGPSKLMVDLAP